MISKQLSVFIENREGRLFDVLRVLQENDVNILSLSLADTAEYGLLRLIVANPTLAKEKLAEQGFRTLVSDVIIARLSHKSGSLYTALKALAGRGVNVEYMYGLCTDKNTACIALKASDLPACEKLLTEEGIETVAYTELI